MLKFISVEITGCDDTFTVACSFNIGNQWFKVTKIRYFVIFFNANNYSISLLRVQYITSPAIVFTPALVFMFCLMVSMVRGLR